MLPRRVSKVAMAKKSPNPIDKHVGGRVRMRRMMLDISQGTLGEALGITFQQVQKYEKGAATESVQAFAAHYPCPIPKCGLSCSSRRRTGVSGSAEDRGRTLRCLTMYLNSSPRRTESGCVKAFTRLPSDKLRRRIVAPVEEIAGHE